MLRDWITLNRDQLLARALDLTRDRADAEDLLQSTIERMLKCEHRQSTIRSFEAFAVRIMSRLFVDEERKKSVRRSGGDPVALEVAAPAPEPIRPEDLVGEEDVFAAVAQLAPAERDVFELREGRGRSYAEISRQLGMAEGTVATTLMRARRKLKDILLKATECRHGGSRR